MQKIQTNNIASSPVAETQLFQDSIVDHEELLQSFGLNYKKVEYYLQVGEIEKTQGWILHLSVVLSQVGDLLMLVIPFLSESNVPFKIPINESAGEDILSGNLGIAQIGKIVSIYPEDDSACFCLAKNLIQLTNNFKGPAVPTDICLKNIVYTRYGSFNPVTKPDINGNQEKYIYDQQGELIKDPYSIPFQLPNGVEWPFEQLTSPTLPEPPKLLNHLYKILEVLKPDPRGNVFKGLFVKNIFQVKNCVLKQGYVNSASDKAGRDICDRLAWQVEIYNELASSVPMPIIYDLIHESSFTLLVMEYIKGDSLFDKMQDINPRCKSWLQLSESETVELISYGKELTRIISQMHKRGFLHRDINPVNFLITKKGKIIMIDLELAYSFSQHKPNPPFTLGTPGFMSPEQEYQKKPDIQQDIYSLAATLIFSFTGLTPIKFNPNNTDALITNLLFFIGNQEIAVLLANCLNPNPVLRPSIDDISTVLAEYQKELVTRRKSQKDTASENLDDQKLKEVILAAIRGLTRYPVVSGDGLWYSKKITIQNFTATKSKQYTKYPGLFEGICGPLYLLARLHKAGIDIDSSKERFFKGWKLIEGEYLNQISALPSGFFWGASGIALTLAESINSGLIEESELNKERISRCLELPNEGLDLARGIAGQGVVILQCANHINEELHKDLLNKIIGHLLSVQQKDGSWLNSVNKGQKRANLLDFNHTDSGIIWFLLEYLDRYPNQDIQNAIDKALIRVLSNTENMTHFFAQVASRSSYEIGDGGKGFILILIKTFQIFQKASYKKLAEKALLTYPRCVVNTNFNQLNGLVGLGELYLEAWKTFEDEEWKIRAHWIAQLFLHTFNRTRDDSGYWAMEENNPPTADFLTGISGVIHFLGRCHHPDKIGYRLLK